MRVPALAALALAAACSSKSSSPSGSAPAGSAAAGSDTAAGGAAAGSAAAGSVAAGLAALGFDTGSTAAGSAAPSATSGLPASLDLGIALAPQERGDAAQAALATVVAPLAKVMPALRAAGYAALAREAPGQRPAAYDLDRDGSVDLVVLPMSQRRLGNDYSGWFVATLTDGTLGLPFMNMGMWADVRVAKGTATLRFLQAFPAGGIPIVSSTFHFANHTWARPVRSQIAVQTQIPEVKPPYARFTVSASATLRTAPVVDDASDHMPDIDFSETLRGNVIATYPAGAHGLVLARHGEFRYVGFDPESRA